MADSGRHFRQKIRRAARRGELSNKGMMAPDLEIKAGQFAIMLAKDQERLSQRPVQENDLPDLHDTYDLRKIIRQNQAQPFPMELDIEILEDTSSQALEGLGGVLQPPYGGLGSDLYSPNL